MKASKQTNRKKPDDYFKKIDPLPLKGRKEKFHKEYIVCRGCDKRVLKFKNLSYCLECKSKGRSEQ